MSLSTQNKKHNHLSIREICVFAILGTLMFVSKIVMEGLPNVHLLGMLTMTYTIVFRKKALVPIYVYVFLNGLYAGFNAWWIPYLYLWTILWAVTMILPRNMNRKAACIIYPIICALHGLAFGTLYAPAQALMYGFTFKQTVAWIVSGLPWDAVHAAGNFAAGLLIYPASEALKKLIKRI